MKKRKNYYAPFATIEKVTNRHSKKCEFCGKKPKNLRIVIWSESSRAYWQMDCYCIDHGLNILREKIKFLKLVLKDSKLALKELEKQPEIEENTFCTFLDLKE